MDEKRKRANERRRWRRKHKKLIEDFLSKADELLDLLDAVSVDLPASTAQMVAQLRAAYAAEAEPREPSKEEVHEILGLFKEFLMKQAIEFGRMEMAIRDLLSDGQARSLEDIAEAIYEDQGRALKCLQNLAKSGQAKKVEDGKWALTWIPRTDDGIQDAEPPPAEPPPDVPLEPKSPAPRQTPIFREKRSFPYFEDDIRDRFL